ASGWYAIVLGPYPPEEAARQLELLRGERLIPSDSYIADAGRFRQRFWPVGEAAVVPAAPAPAEAATETPVIATAEPAPVETPAIEETPAQARAAEAALDADERKALQEALQWYGHYTGAIDGAIGPGTRKSMAAWQIANGRAE